MDYLKQLMKMSGAVNNNTQSFGGYSPLSGFDNEDELDKNPYQQILSSAPKTQTQDPFDKYLMDNNRYDLLAQKNNINDPMDLIKLHQKQQASKGLGIPDGVNIDSTFYNRKDIYDITERLKASGIDVPDKKKDKPGLITRALDILSTPGYAVTTALHNALDGDDDTKALKGMLDGIVGGLTSNSDKYRDGSDLMDLAIGEQGKDASFGEKTGRFLGGTAMDILLDPTTYLTLGTSALVKGATKTVGKEVTQEAVEKAIKGVNSASDLAKAGQGYDIATQSARITKRVNDTLVTKRKGLEINIPFGKDIEIISPERVAEIGKALGIQDTLGKGLGLAGDTVKGVWNYKKGEKSLRSSIEAIPKGVLEAINWNDYKMNSLIKSNPIEGAKALATREVTNRLSTMQNEVKDGFFKVADDLFSQLKDLQDSGVDTSDLVKTIEQMKMSITNESINEKGIEKAMSEIIDDANKRISKANDNVKTKEGNIYDKFKEALNGAKLEFDEITKAKEILNSNNVEEIIRKTEEQILKKIEPEEPFKFEDLGKSMSDYAKENGAETEWETYVFDGRKNVEEFMSSTGIDNKEFQELLNMTKDQKSKWFDNLFEEKKKGIKPKNLAESPLNVKKELENVLGKKLSREEFESYGDGKVLKKINDVRRSANKPILNKTKSGQWYTSKLSQNDYNKATKEISNLKKNLEDAEKVLKEDQKLFARDNKIIEPYETATEFDDIYAKMENDILKQEKEALKRANQLTKDNSTINPKTGKEFTKAEFLTNGKKFSDMSEAEIEREADEFVKMWFDRDFYKGKDKQYKDYSMDYFKEEYIKTIKEGKEFIKNGNENHVANFTRHFKDKIKESANSLLDMKDQIVKELGLGNKAYSDLVDKYLEQKIMNMGNPKSKYFVSPFEPITYQKLKDEISMFINGNQKTGLVGVNEFLRKTGHYDAFKEGKSILNGANIKSIQGKKALMHEDFRNKVQAEARTLAKDILSGRGIDVSRAGYFNEKGIATVYGDIGDIKAGTYDVDVLLKKLNKETPNNPKYTIDNLPNNVKVENLGGVQQQIEREIDKHLRKFYGKEYEDANGKKVFIKNKFGNLPEEEQSFVIKKATRIVEDFLEKEHFGANKNMLTGQTIGDIQKQENAFNRYNDPKTKDIGKSDYLDQKEYDAGISARRTEAILNMPEDIREKFLKRKDDKKGLEKLLRELDNKIAYKSENLTDNSLRKGKQIEAQNELKRLMDSVNIVEKELNILDDLNGNTIHLDAKGKVDNSTNVKSVDEVKDLKGRDTVQTHDQGIKETISYEEGVQELNKALINAPETQRLSWKTEKQKYHVDNMVKEHAYRKRYKEWEEKNFLTEIEYNVSQKLPDGISIETVVGNDFESMQQFLRQAVKTKGINKMNVPELRDMLKDYGIKGISKSNREELLKIADVVAGGSGRIGINVDKMTIDEMKTFMKKLGIKDKGFSQALREYTKSQNLVEKMVKTADGLGKSKAFFTATGFTQQFERQMTNLFGKNGAELWQRKVEKVMKESAKNRNKEIKALTPIEALELKENKEILEALGGGEKVDKFVKDYISFMSNMLSDEIDFGVDVKGIIKQGYVPRRMSKEALEKTMSDANLSSYLENYVADLKMLKTKPQKFQNQRKNINGKYVTNIAEINDYIYKETAKKFGEEGAIKNFYETDLSRLIVQRVQEHGKAFYDSSMNNLYLNKLGVELSWVKNEDGSMYNIVNDASGVKYVDDGLEKGVREQAPANWRSEKGANKEISYLIHKGKYKDIEAHIKNYLPNANYFPDETLDKVQQQALKSLENLRMYSLENSKPNKARYEKLVRELHLNMPEMAFAREMKTGVKRGDIVLVYPEGMTKTKSFDALKDGKDVELLGNEMWSDLAKKYGDSIEYKTLDWEAFEKINAETKDVKIFALRKNVYDTYQTAMTQQLEKDVPSFLKVYDSFSNVWKKMATTSVGFHVRNAFGNVFQQYLDVGTKISNPKYIQASIDMLKETDDILFTSKDGVEYTGKKLMELFKQQGLTENNQMAKEFSKYKKGTDTIGDFINNRGKSSLAKATEGKNPISKMFGISQWAGDNIEQFAKRQQFAIHIENGLDPVSAMERVNKVLFDYSDLTEFETDVMKRIIPFYTFMRKNTELQIDTIMNNPTPLKNARRILENQQKSMLSTEEEQLLTDTDRDKIILGGKKNRTVSTNLPWLQDVNPLGALNPLIKTPLEMATNKNFTFKNDISAYDGQVKEASPFEGLIGGLLGQTEIGQDGTKYIDAKAKHLITNLLPSVRTMDRSVDNVTGEDKIGGLMALLGLGGQEFSVDKRTSYEVREYKELLENLEKKAQSKGINTREELKKKKELEELMNALGVMR